MMHMNDNTWMIVNLVWAVFGLIAIREGLKTCVNNLKGIPGMLRLITYGVIILGDCIVFVSLIVIISLIVHTG